MARNSPICSQVISSSLSERPDRRGMRAVGAAHPSGEARRQQADGERARSRQRLDVCFEHRLPVASDPQGLAAALNGVRLFRSVELDGTLDRIHEALYRRCREEASREASPTAAIIDSQSVKSAEKCVLHRSARLRCRQEDQGQEAARSCRYARPPDARDRAFRRHSGPRRRRAADGKPVRSLPVPG